MFRIMTLIAEGVVYIVSLKKKKKKILVYFMATALFVSLIYLYYMSI